MNPVRHFRELRTYENARQAAKMIFDVGVNWFFRGDEAINPFVGLSWRF